MIRADDIPAVLTIDVEGPATMIESPAVHEAVMERLLGGLRELRVDLRDCTTMDSTFSGTLLSLKRHLDKVGATLTLVSPSPKVLELLGQMGLDDFYAIDEAERTNAAWTKITPTQPGLDELRQLVLHAHDELGRRPGPAAQAFRNVADQLRRDEETEARGEPASLRYPITSRDGSVRN